VRRLRFTLPAAKQIARVLDYIDERNPQGARNVEDRIQQMMHLLLEHPDTGSPTSRAGMRRIVALPYPYAIYYRASEEEIVIHGVRHTGRRPIM
jgi:toxin ParE1/3/4